MVLSTSPYDTPEIRDEKKQVGLTLVQNLGRQRVSASASCQRRQPRQRFATIDP